MSAGLPGTVTISLSAAQVREVLRAVSHERPPALATLLAGRDEAPSAHNGAPRGPAPPAPGDVDERRLSRSLMRGLALLGAIRDDGAERGIVELAAELGMSPSTAHRYALTLVELGLLERCPRTRKYRLAARAA